MRVTCRYRRLRSARWRSDRIGCGSGLACSRLSTAASLPGRASRSSRTATSIVVTSAPISTAGHDNLCGPCRWPLIDQAATEPSTRPGNPARIARRQRSRIPSRRPPSRAKITAVTRVNSPPSTGTPNKKPGPLSRTALTPVRRRTAQGAQASRVPSVSDAGHPGITPAIPASLTLGTGRLVERRPAGHNLGGLVCR